MTCFSIQIYSLPTLPTRPFIPVPSFPTFPNFPSTAIPSTCLDQSGAHSLSTGTIPDTQGGSYRPFKTREGYIAFDFNHDRFNDFIFLEKKRNANSQLNLVTCLSNRNGTYQRRGTPFTVKQTNRTANLKEWLQVEVLDRGTLSVSVKSYSQNDGGRASKRIFEYDNSVRDFVDITYLTSESGMKFKYRNMRYDFKALTLEVEFSTCSLVAGSSSPCALGVMPRIVSKTACLRDSSEISTIRHRWPKFGDSDFSCN